MNVPIRQRVRLIYHIMKLYEYISSRGGTSVIKTRMNYVRLYIPDSMKQIFNVKKSYIEVLYNRPYLGDMFGDDTKITSVMLHYLGFDPESHKNIIGMTMRQIDGRDFKIYISFDMRKYYKDLFISAISKKLYAPVFDIDSSDDECVEQLLYKHGFEHLLVCNEQVIYIVCEHNRDSICPITTFTTRQLALEFVKLVYKVLWSTKLDKDVIKEIRQIHPRLFSNTSSVPTYSISSINLLNQNKNYSFVTSV